jgi:hypothetical protein
LIWVGHGLFSRWRNEGNHTRRTSSSTKEKTFPLFIGPGPGRPTYQPTYRRIAALLIEKRNRARSYVHIQVGSTLMGSAYRPNAQRNDGRSLYNARCDEFHVYTHSFPLSLLNGPAR